MFTYSKPRRFFPVLALALLLAAPGPPAGAAPSELVAEISSLEPAGSGGLRALDRALVRLSSHRRLLIVAAHPDDEDTSLLTWVARGLGGEAAYLSLSRGDGGQNLIGPELGVGLGLLRSRELGAARRIDGARQFFTRAYDFGYTRSVDETFERWPKEVLLEDAVRVIRRFKPQVVVAIFPATDRAGHGQHQASAVVAEEALELAADPAALPRLRAEGLAPWRIDAFYRAAWWDPESATVEIPLGTIEPFTGRSILQIALESRSQHRCQDMGSILPLGDATGRLTWVSGGAGASGEEVFAGVDTSLPALADLLPEGAPAERIRSRLERVAELADGARERLDATDPTSAVQPLLEVLRQLRAVAGELEGAGGDDGATHLRELLRELVAEKLAIAQEAAANAARVLADGITDRATVVAGERFPVRSLFWNAGPFDVGEPEVEVVSDDGWRLASTSPAPEERSRFRTEVTDERQLEVEVPADAPPTLPYFLRRPLDGSLYDWSDVPPAVRGEPFGPPPLRLRFRFELEGVPIALEREVVHRHRDQALGEVRRPLRAVPAVEVTVAPELVVWPIGRKEREPLRVEVISNLDRPVRGRLEVGVPAGWPAVGPREVELPPKPGRTVLELPLTAPPGLERGRHRIPVAFVTDAGDRFDAAVRLVDYEHVRPTPMPEPARVEVAADRIRLPALGRVGYVRGASDRVPELLAAVGVPVEVLTGGELATADLTRFDAVVVGSRAYEIDRGLIDANPRLLDYARGGGLLIVQYQQYQFAGGGYAPFPLDVHRPHDRVTDETAPVRLLAPAHPVFHTPNEIGARDWEGWVQERGLYFASEWGDAYTPLLAMADPGGEELRGSLLVARLGEGRYIYTGLAFFRQLPAGVTGAYRLFANLLALGASPE